MRTAAVLLAVAVLSAAVFATGGAAAKDRSEAARSRSLGWPWRGQLERGRAVTDSATVQLLERHRDNGNHFGATSLVGLLERAARRVAATAPGAKLVVGELSAEGGGDIPGHRSHENGLDADVGFYLRNERGEWVIPPHFVNVGGHGYGRLAGERVVWDDAANWTFVETLLTDRETPVQHVFVSNALRSRLLREARRRSASPEMIDRLQRALLQPGSGPRAHREHFHVRMYCPPSDRPECRDRGPYWYWLPPELTPNPALFRELVADGARAVPMMPAP